MTSQQGLPAAVDAYKAGRFEQCLARLSPLIARSGRDSKLILMAAQCHAKLGQLEQAAQYYAQAADLDAENGRMLRLLAARSYRRARRRAPALTLARQAARGGPFDVEAESTYRSLLREQLLLAECEIEDARMLERLTSGDALAFGVDDPHDHIMWCVDEGLNAKVTRMHGGAAFTAQSRLERRSRPHVFGERIRVGYLSNDICDQHATMRLIQGVFLSHDRENFDVTLFCYTDDDVLSADQGLRSQYGTIVSIRELDDAQAADLIRARGIDILVDQKGHTKDARISLVNRGLAPIQVAYLGFPGSGTGIDCDYIIGDRIVTPDSSRPYYHEKFCRLPDSYQANDRLHRVLPPPAMRESLGLPADAFVIASFNAVKKITPRTARLWARTLVAIPRAVLWMMCDDDDARANFIAFMAGLGVAAERIHFARRADYPAHVARLQAADIALDTFPTNGHTTTSDKLWAGLPVLTCKGRNFTSRVSESLLNAIGMPELVADDEDGMVELCIALATDSDRLAEIRARLAENRLVAPLFDTARFTRHLERAYEMMVERERQGLEPDHFDVPALPRPVRSIAVSPT
ncbi:hypothetical protein [Ciceribacter selenitireducens]|uniref:protein O-GlcNAc transferase n=1 Tax=Ciceribacter selenitireducens ATCC BAA-1503 TaxID=1336235 RepID=A0A376AGB1_9HYPH|nr:hypothetical protein [Ciceribacter selenitireducens]SSC66720.1 unnamed protein product [Ciceribacter selenitireducens ATCC BAA-1503]